jgi:hypothetical protein
MAQACPVNRIAAHRTRPSWTDRSPPERAARPGCRVRPLRLIATGRESDQFWAAWPGAPGPPGRPCTAPGWRRPVGQPTSGSSSLRYCPPCLSPAWAAPTDPRHPPPTMNAAVAASATTHRPTPRSFRAPDTRPTGTRLRGGGAGPRRLEGACTVTFGAAGGQTLADETQVSFWLDFWTPKSWRSWAWTLRSSMLTRPNWLSQWLSPALAVLSILT